MLHIPFPMPRVYSYTRFSTPEQAAGDSARRQSEAAKAWAAEHGMELDESLNLTDLGVSAYKGANLGEGTALGGFRDAIERGLVESGSVLLLESLDRLSRMKPRRAVRLLEEIVDAGVTVVTLNDGQRYDSERLDDDHTALMIALIVAIRAHEESATKGRRVAAAWEEKRRKVRAGEAKKLTRRAPAWLSWDDREEAWRVDETKGATVRRIYAMTLAGTGEHKIAETLNREGVPPLGRASRWHRSSVSKILRNPAVVGQLVPGRIEHSAEGKRRVTEEPIADAFPAVIEEADWLAVRGLKDGHAPAVRGRGAGHPLANLFSGLARCPLCRSTMTRVSKGSRRKAGKPKLVCTKAKEGAGCRYVGVPLDAVEGGLVDHVAWLVEDIPAGGRGEELDREASAMRGTVAGLEEHYADLVEAVDRVGPSAKAAERMARLGAEIDSAKAALDALDERRRLLDGGLLQDRALSLANAVRDFDGTNREPINAAMRLLFDGVVIDYPNHRLLFEWRQGGTTPVPYAFEFPGGPGWTADDGNEGERLG